MLRALFKQGRFWPIINEKTFRDRGSRIMWDILVGILVDFEIKQEK